MAAKQTRRKPPKDDRSTEDRLIDAALDLAAEQAWRGIGLADIAEAASVPLSTALVALPGKLDILQALIRRTDAAVFASLDADPLDGTVKDKLFDLLMRRFDVLAGRRAALKSIAWATARDPLSAACLALTLSRSLARTLEAAGVSSAGCQGALRTKALGAIYLAAAEAWIKDEDPGLAATMARLDKGLSRAEQLATSGFALRNRGKKAPDEAPAP